MITFAVIGHNEAPTLGRALDQATEAATVGDVVWFLDSASTDESSKVAHGKHIKHVRAPLGKGRAMGHAIEQADTEFICFIDADLVSSSRNIPLALAEAVRAESSDMVVGEFEDSGIASNTIGVYTPLVAGLFPEAAGRYGSRPLSGFRIMRRGQNLGNLPGDFGVETHLNIRLALAQAKTAVCPIGRYEGRFLYKPHMGKEISRAILDLAVSSGRLDAARRQDWEDWVNVVVDHIAAYKGDLTTREAFSAKLYALASRPLPTAHS